MRTTLLSAPKIIKPPTSVILFLVRSSLMISLSWLTSKSAIAYAPLSVILFYRRLSSFIIPFNFRKLHSLMQCSSVMPWFSMWITVGWLILKHLIVESKYLVIDILVLKITSLRSLRKRVLTVLSPICICDLSVFNCPSLIGVLITLGFKCSWIAWL